VCLSMTGSREAPIRTPTMEPAPMSRGRMSTRFGIQASPPALVAALEENRLCLSPCRRRVDGRRGPCSRGAHAS
jgi:hypothetical protein